MAVIQQFLNFGIVGRLFSGIRATGGDAVIDYGGYRIHIFTSPGSFVVSSLGTSDGTVDYLVVAGGGGGGRINNSGTSVAGGGGAGGLRTGSGFPVTVTTYPITVGAGGAENAGGAPSTFSTITSNGGGYGHGNSGPAQSGGSGG